MMGTWMLLAALPFYIYRETGSALMTSALLMAYIAPGVLFGSVAGVFVDRWDRKRVLVIGNLLQAAIIPLLLLVEANGWFWLIYVAVFMESTISQFLGPAENALLPTLVGEDQLISANSLNSLNDNLARIVGAALGGLLLGAVGFQSIIIIDAVTYLAAAILISLVVAVATKAPRQQEEVVVTSQWRQVYEELRDGLRIVTNNVIIRSLFIVIGIALFGDAILSALLAVFAQEVAGFTELDYGWLLTARGVGGIVGGLAVAQFGARFSTSQLISGGLAISGLGVLVMVLFPTLPVVTALMILVGPALMGWMISMQTVLQQETEDRYRGRIFGVYGTTSTILMFAGSGLAGFLADTLGSSILMGSAGLIYVVAGLLSQPLKQAAAAAAATSQA